MRYETVQHLKEAEFKRLTGVQRETFEKMRKVIEKGMRDFGRPPKLSRADQLLMTLMYWREYRTEFHIAQSYGISESAVCRTIQKVEDTLVHSRKFRLPGKRRSSPVRPSLMSCWWTPANSRLSIQKKPKSSLQRQKEAAYPKSAVDC